MRCWVYFLFLTQFQEMVSIIITLVRLSLSNFKCYGHYYDFIIQRAKSGPIKICFFSSDYLSIFILEKSWLIFLVTNYQKILIFCKHKYFHRRKILIRILKGTKKTKWRLGRHFLMLCYRNISIFLDNFRIFECTDCEINQGLTS